MPDGGIGRSLPDSLVQRGGWEHPLSGWRREGGSRRWQWQLCTPRRDRDRDRSSARAARLLPWRGPWLLRCLAAAASPCAAPCVRMLLSGGIWLLVSWHGVVPCSELSFSPGTADPPQSSAGRSGRAHRGARRCFLEPLPFPSIQRGCSRLCPVRDLSGADSTYTESCSTKAGSEQESSLCQGCSELQNHSSLQGLGWDLGSPDYFPAGVCTLPPRNPRGRQHCPLFPF